MDSDGIFDSIMNPDLKMGAFFEDDGTTGYFYLFDDNEAPHEKVRGALKMYSRPMNLKSGEVEVHLDEAGVMAGVFIRGVLWGVWDLSLRKCYGGDFDSNQGPRIPEQVTRNFKALPK